MFAQIFETNLADCYHAPEASLLLMLWEVARNRRRMPGIGDIPRSRLVYLEDDLMILRPISGNDFYYEHYGRRIEQNSGFNMKGKKVSDFTGDVRDFYRDLYVRVCAEKRPLGSLHRLGRYGEIPSWERIILPLGDTEVEQLLVMNKVRSFAADLVGLDVAARGKGVIIIQFNQDVAGNHAGSEIAGANAAAKIAVGKRSDELLGKQLDHFFPALNKIDLWALYNSELPVDTTPGESGPRHHVVVGDAVVSAYPFHDNLVIEFNPIDIAPYLAERAFQATAFVA